MKPIAGPSRRGGDQGEPDDADLVRRCLQEDPEAFRLLVERYQGEVFSLDVRLVGGPEVAEDLSVERFLRAFRALGR
jgi:RNA polymerase sigma-70 factor (ECF subfamily)